MKTSGIENKILLYLLFLSVYALRCIIAAHAPQHAAPPIGPQIKGYGLVNYKEVKVIILASYDALTSIAFYRSFANFLLCIQYNITTTSSDQIAGDIA